MNVWNIKSLNKGRRGTAQESAVAIHIFATAFRLEVHWRTLHGSHCSQDNIVFGYGGNKDLCIVFPWQNCY